MKDIAIKVEKLNKTFRLPHDQQSSLKGLLLNFGKRDKGYEVQKVLQDVSFEIKKGEFFGIVGRNGSGKSTLLKLLAGIYSPDEGLIQVDGKLTPFIELGVGFNPELSGKENVFLNGALLGYSRAQMREMYDDIVEFAELEQFMDQKLKNYSSGMQVRLAFSIAIKSKSEILIFDEVLAVGDERFQQKCVKVFRDFKKQKRTVVLVTHDMGNVERFCDRALVLDKSRVLAVTTPNKAATMYSRLNIDEQKIEKDNAATQQSKNVRLGSGEVTVKEAHLQKEGVATNVFQTGEPLSLRLEIAGKGSAAATPFQVGLAIYNDEDIVVIGPNSMSAKKLSSAKSTVTMTIPSLPLKQGTYAMTIVIYDEDAAERYDYLEKWINFSVVSDHVIGGLVEVESKWEMQ